MSGGSVWSHITVTSNKLGEFDGEWKKLRMAGREETLYYFVPNHDTSYDENTLLDRSGRYRTSLPEGVVVTGREEKFPGEVEDFSTLLQAVKESEITGTLKI